MAATTPAASSAAGERAMGPRHSVDAIRFYSYPQPSAPSLLLPPTAASTLPLPAARQPAAAAHFIYTCPLHSGLSSFDENSQILTDFRRFSTMVAKWRGAFS